MLSLLRHCALRAFESSVTIGLQGVPLCQVLPKNSLSTMSSVPILFRQLFDDKSSTYTYLVADKDSKEAVLIDPVIDKVDRDLKLVEELGLQLKLAINTHMHADHVTGTGLIKKRLVNCKSAISEASGAKADVLLKDGDTVRISDRFSLEVRSTPGHTDGCVTYVMSALGCAFTGDAVMIRGCGRTDFQQGNPSTLYDSVHCRIFSLPDNYILYPAHDYKGMTSTSVAEEKLHNPRLSKGKAEFIEIMNNLNLSYPKQIDVAVPLNRVCGIQDDVSAL